MGTQVEGTLALASFCSPRKLCPLLLYSPCHCAVNPIVRSHCSKSHRSGCPSLMGGGDGNGAIEIEGERGRDSERETETRREGAGKKKVTAIWDDSTSMSGDRCVHHKHL